MRQFLFPAAFAATIPIAASPAAASQMQINVDGPVVELQTTETVLGDPDKALVGAGVTTRAQTAAEAMRMNAQAMDKVIKQIEALGVAEERIQTTGVSLNPQYTYRNNLPPQFIGYDASNTVSVELRDMDRIGTVLDALVQAGATNLSGPSFAMIDPEPARKQARKAAFDHARDQAESYARMAGYSGVRLLGIEESIGYSQPIAMNEMAAVAAAAPPPARPPIRPGRVGTHVTITAKYELTR